MSYDRQEFDELLNAACNETLTLAQTARLEEIIASDAEACRLYDQYMQLDLEMHYLARSLPKAAERELVRPSVRGKPVRTRQVSDSSLLTLTYWREHRGQFFSLAGVLTLMLWAGFYFFVRPYWSGGESTTVHEYAAQVVGTHQVQWAAGAQAWEAGSSLERESVLEIESGYLEIEFSKGAVVVLEGPARLETTLPNAGKLEFGRLVARIERKEAGGFSVTTPLAQVTDYGTEFGVESSAVRGTEVEVFVGSVDATPLARGEDNRVHPLRLAAGQAASLAVGATQFVERNAEPERYVASLPASEQGVLPARLIRPQAVECSIADQFSRPAERLIDGSGLAVGESGQRVHAGGAAEACCGNGDVNCWIAPMVEGKPVLLTFDLGREYELSAARVWNYSNSELGSYLGTREVHVSYSSDGQFFEESDVIWVPQAEELSAQEEVLGLSAVTRYVRLEIANNQVPINGEPQPYVGLGEVRFEGRPVVSEEDTANP